MSCQIASRRCGAEELVSSTTAKIGLQPQSNLLFQAADLAGARPGSRQCTTLHDLAIPAGDQFIFGAGKDHDLGLIQLLPLLPAFAEVRKILTFVSPLLR
jgi:hypothetical protein